jgi:hypothetical protein
MPPITFSHPDLLQPSRGYSNSSVSEIKTRNQKDQSTHYRGSDDCGKWRCGPSPGVNVISAVLMRHRNEWIKYKLLDMKVLPDFIVVFRIGLKLLLHDPYAAGVRDLQKQSTFFFPVFFQYSPFVFHIFKIHVSSAI